MRFSSVERGRRDQARLGVVAHLEAHGHGDEDHERDQHHPGEEQEVPGLGGQVTTARVTDHVVGHGHEHVTGGDAPQVQTHDDRLHVLGRLGVGELQTHDRDRHLGHRDEHVSEELPPDGRGQTEFDLGLHPSIDQEREDCEQHPETNLAERRERDHLVHGRVDHKLEERDESQDQERIGGLDGGRIQVEAEHVPVHLQRLQHPGRPGLIVQGPVDRDQQVDGHQSQHCLEAGRVEGVADEVLAARGDVRKLVPPHPEHDRGQEHEHARHAKGDVGTVVVQQPGREQRGQRRAEVDGEVEQAEDPLQHVLVLLPELITHVGGHAGLDAPGSEGDQPETHRQTESSVIHRQGQVPQTVETRQDHDGTVLAQEGVREDRSGERDVVRRSDEGVKPGRCLVATHDRCLATPVDQELRHVDHENGLHAVEAEAFSGFVSHDVRDTLGDVGIVLRGHRPVSACNQ